MMCLFLSRTVAKTLTRPTSVLMVGTCWSFCCLDGWLGCWAGSCGHPGAASAHATHAAKQGVTTLVIERMYTFLAIKIAPLNARGSSPRSHWMPPRALMDVRASTDCAGKFTTKFGQGMNKRLRQCALLLGVALLVVALAPLGARTPQQTSA